MAGVLIAVFLVSSGWVTVSESAFPECAPGGNSRGCLDAVAISRLPGWQGQELPEGLIKSGFEVVGLDRRAEYTTVGFTVQYLLLGAGCLSSVLGVAYLVGGFVLRKRARALKQTVPV